MDTSDEEDAGLSPAAYFSAGLSEALCRPLDYPRAVAEISALCLRGFHRAPRSLQKQLADDVGMAIQQCTW